MQEGTKSVVTVDEIENLLVQLPGVISARIVVNDWGAVEEVHILASDARSPKQVVRDVESSMAAKWGLYVDHKKISVAQIAGTGGHLAPFRLKLINVEMSADTVSGRIKASVTLGRTDQEGVVCRGECEGPCAKNFVHRVFGEATIDALNRAVDPGNGITLESVEVLNTGSRHVALSVVVLVSQRGHEEVLVGAVPVRADASEAVVKSVLDAVNRRISKLVLKGRRVAGALGGESSQ
ncbi:MAG: hypothetical protein AB1576_02315 [Bacillota bacterium]|jgi:hypothetical protein